MNAVVAVPGRVEADVIEAEVLFLRDGADLRRAAADLVGFLRPLQPQPPRSEGSVRQLLARAGLGGVSTRSFVMLCGGCGLVALLAIQLISGAFPVALAFGAMAGYLPVAVVAGRARRRQRELAEVWPEAVDNLASAVRAGMSLPEALAGLGTRGPEPLRPAFQAFALDYQVSGRFADCLDRLKAELSSATTHAPAPSSSPARPGPSTASIIIDRRSRRETGLPKRSTAAAPLEPGVQVWLKRSLFGLRAEGTANQTGLAKAEQCNHRLGSGRGVSGRGPCLRRRHR